MQRKKKKYSPAIQSLVISSTGKQKLTKNQEAFNKLTKRIEKLQQDIQKKQLQYDTALKLYGTALHPAEQKMLKVRHQLILALWGIYNGRRLAKANQPHLKTMLQYHLQEYFQQSDTEPDKDLQDIFSAIEGIAYSNMMADEKANMEAEMREMFAEVDVDITGVDLDDTDTLSAKWNEAREKLAAQDEWHQQQQKKADKKQTAKQQAQEKIKRAMEEMKQKNIGTIYKQLAKLFHPDLEQDIERKAEKEILMKELTAAYEAKNLHALLTLELRWIHNETNHLETLTEEKLSIYLEILREQARELEQQKAAVLYQPQYSVLSSRFGFNIQQYPVESIHRELGNVQLYTELMLQDVDGLSSEMALRYVNELLKGWKKQQRQMDEEDLFESVFG